LPSNKATYPRPKLNQSERDKYVAGLIDQLRDLERKTDPKNGVKSAKGKNLAARDALKIAGDLVNALAGWALDHQAGLALKDLKSVPLSTAEPPEHPDHSNALPSDDDHRHEWYGRNWVGRLGSGFDIDPIVGRKWLINLVCANPGIFNLELMLMTMSALEACDYGEIHPMLKATKKGRKVNWTILRLQMRAITLVKKRETHGMKKFKALQEVADAFGVSVDTVRTWERRLRSEFGNSEVPNVLENATFELIESEARYAQDLKENARQYKLALAGKRSAKGASQK
jgi:DNA-binding transcriptional regulator YiaG